MVASPITNGKHPPCRKCGSTQQRERLQVFDDGKQHRRLECAGCGKYLKFLPLKQSQVARPHMVNGERPIRDFEDCLTARIAEDTAIGNELAGRIGDHLMLAADSVRRRYRLAGPWEVGA